MNMKNVFLLIVAVMLFVALPEELNAQVTPPVFSEDFEMTQFEGIPDGWDGDSIGGNAKWMYYRGGVGGSVCMAYENGLYGVMGYNMLVSPVIRSESGLALSFDYKMSSNDEFGTTGMYVYISYDGGESFEGEPVWSSSRRQDEWHNVVCPLPVSPTGKMVLGFMGIKGNEYSVCSLYVDNVVVDYEPRCAYPENLELRSVASDSVLLAWSVAEMGAISQSVEVSLMQDGREIRNYTVETPVMGQTALRNLEDNTVYSVKIRMDCEEAYLGKSRWSEEVEFTTLCSPISVPVLYTFDDWNEIPACWVTEKDNPGDGMTRLSERFIRGSNGKALEAAYNSSNTYIYTEPVGHAADDLEISLWLYNNSIGEKSFEIGLQSDIKSVGTYVGIKSVKLPKDEWVKMVAYTDNNIMGAVENAAVVLWAKGFGYNYLYIDDLSIRPIPDCRQPQDVKITAVGDDYAEFEWSGTEDAKLAVYDVKSGEDTVLLGTVEVNGGKLEGLSPDTEYDLMYKCVCGAGQESEWGIDRNEVRTACEPVQPPLSADFEDGVLPDCWRNDGCFVPFSQRTVKWDISNAQAYSGSYSLRFNYEPYEPCAPLVLPYMHIPENDLYIVRFYMHRTKAYSYNEDQVNIYFNSRPDTVGATLLGSVYRCTELEPQTELEGWMKYEFPLPDSGLGYVIIEGCSDNGNPLYIDNVTVMKMPSCVEPMGIEMPEDRIEPDRVSVSWVPQTDAPQWEVSYSMEGEETPVKEVVTGDTEYVIDDLTPNTNYDIEVSVRAICSAGDTSDVCTSRFSLVTPCEVTDVVDKAWKETFDSGSLGCWKVVQGNPSISGGRLMLNESAVLLVLPEFNYSSVSDYQLRLLYEVNDSESSLDVGVMSTPDIANSFELVETIEGSPDAQYYTVSFDEYEGDGKYIALRYKGYGLSYYISYIHSMELMSKAPCADVEDLVVDMISDSSAMFTVGGASVFDAEYGYKGFAPGSGTLLEEVESPILITGLEADKEYELYVRVRCDEGVGNWSSPLSFRTPCAAYMVTDETPFADGFEDTEGMGCWHSTVITGNQEWRVLESTYDAYSGYFCAGLDATGYYQDSEADLYHPVALKAGITYEFSCYVKVGSDSYNGYRFGVSYGDAATPDDPSAMDIVPMTDMNPDGQYRRIRVAFTPKKDASVLRIRGYVIAGYGRMTVDDIRIEPVYCVYPDISVH